ncbi:MAG: hypothetical protein WBM38_08340 [Arenicellales bacterium]
MRSNTYSLLLLLLLMPAKEVLADKQDYCTQGNGRTVLFLIDRTSAFDEQDKISFANGIDVLFKQLQAGERLIIHTLTEDFAASKKIFDACRPGCVEQGWYRVYSASAELQGPGLMNVNICTIC